MDSTTVAVRTTVQTATERAMLTRRYGLFTLPVSRDLAPHLQDSLVANGLSEEEARHVLAETGEYAPSYREFLNAAGIEAEPIIFHEDDDQIVSRLEEFDGVFLTGGDTLFDLEAFVRDGQDYFRVVMNADKPYLRKVRRILEKVKAINTGGRYFPLFAVCLGYEAILLAETDFAYPIAHVRQNNANIPIVFTGAPTRMAEVFDEEERRELSSHNMIYFYHDLGFLPQDFDGYAQLRDNYVISAYNETDAHGAEIAAFEHRELPIFATQFHPEKVAFDNSAAYIVNRCDRGRSLNVKFADVLQEECRGHKEVPCYDEMVAQAGMHSVTVHNVGGMEHMTFVSRNPHIKLLAAAGTH